MPSLLRTMLIAASAGLAYAGPAAAAFVDPIPDPIPLGPTTVRLSPFASGLVSPNTMIPARDGTGRSFVVEQSGQVRTVTSSGSVLPTPFLDVSRNLVELNRFYDERGLLGMALHPNFATNGKLYTYHSAPFEAGRRAFRAPNSDGAVINHQSVVTEWTVDTSDSNRVDPASAREILRIDQPQFNHNAGALAFGPDGNLYIAVGDGGSADDQNGIPQDSAWGPATPNGHAPEGNGQSLQTALGKILRINVDGVGTPSDNGAYAIPADNPFVGTSGAVEEIYAYGFRNPFRMSFAADGRLLVGDVGQLNVEEIDDVVSGGNYGWRVKEGSFLFNPNGPADDSTVDRPASPGSPAGLIDPVLQYDHSDGIAVIAGFIYEGSAIPELRGKYIFGDLSLGFAAGPAGRLFAGDLETGEIVSLLAQPMSFWLKGLALGDDGEIYALVSVNLGPEGFTGRILRLAAVPEPGVWGLFAAGLLGLLIHRTRRLR